MEQNQKISKITVKQKNYLYLLVAFILGLLIYKFIGPKPPLSDDSHQRLEAHAKELEKINTEETKEGPAKRSEWYAEHPEIPKPPKP
ncbi:hypothetical protein LG201_07360 [Methylobacillus gramineus]|uniref:hypothetical protein n=1 Tax=Methylobacillus gramineus TaxID=755169 RepID=UPI001CFF6E56|nr:hypothetical protein [Methylobacillus gramineus]MCB5185019.1 hypothetical protein [Methylobacillus gramineus]